MKNKTLQLFFLFLIPIFSGSCNNCRNVDCIGPYGTIEANFFKDGEDILFGENPISIDSFLILYKDDQSIEFRGDFSIDTGNQVVNIEFFSDEILLIQAPGIEDQEIGAEFKEVSEGECCPEFEIEKITLNGIEVCITNCEGEILKINLD